MICRIRLLLAALAASSSGGGVAGFSVPAAPTVSCRPRLAGRGGGSRPLAAMPPRDDGGRGGGGGVRRAPVVGSSSSFDFAIRSSSESPPPPPPPPLPGGIVVENGPPPRGCDDLRRSSAAAVALASAACLLLLASSPPDAHAAGPDWGLFEGRTGSLLHPVAMISMLALSSHTALLGFRWRRQRTLGDEISALRKTLPDLGGAGSAGEALRAAEAAETVDAPRARALRDALETEATVAELTRERRELANAGPRDRHFNQGSLLLFVGTAFAIEGPLNTYARAGKLFPGPHLYAGAGLVVLWSLAACMVPYMQRGSDAARAVHVGANLVGIGLFAWQVTTGLPILFKVLELTKWP